MRQVGIGVENCIRAALSRYTFVNLAIEQHKLMQMIYKFNAIQCSAKV